MSKAFTRESDENEDLAPPARAVLPPGVKNYITPEGAQRLRDEASALMNQRVSGEAKDQLQAARLRQLQEIIPTLVIAEPPTERDAVRFGARVSVRRQSGPETYRLVGIDETDLDRNQISWLSPLAKALLGKRPGERVVFRSPSGVEEITIVEVNY